MDELEIITTSDGSHTLRNHVLNETYHSVHGAVQESAHVFIRNGLEFFHQRYHPKEISVLEVGFGTGLNAFLTFEYARDHEVRIRYTTVEPFPLQEDVWSKLNYGDGDRATFDGIHRAPWEEDVVIAPMFTIHKKKSSLRDVQISDRYDVVFFDAFGPSVQPELWEYDSLEKSISELNHPGAFVTYSAKGQVKRDLRALGLSVETLAGPPGKLQMIRAMA